MNTQSHILLAAALFTKAGRQHRPRNIAALAGGFVPDLPIFVMFAWSKIVGAPEGDVWKTWYFSPPWQTWIDASHSIPLLVLVLLVGLAAKARNLATTGIVFITFSLAALTHVAGDFFLHVVDGHAHFWPLSDWRFSSPVSYWDPNFYGQYVLAAELAFAFYFCYLLYRRFSQRWVHVLLALTIVAYIAVPAYFIFIVKHH